MLKYKGYVGEVVYDDDAHVLHARVINSGPYPVANAEATDVEGIEREFQTSIDVYLDGCAELGIEPVKPQGESRKSAAAEPELRARLEACVAADPGDGSAIREVLGEIARSTNMSEVARKIGMDRAALYKALSQNGNPSFATVLKVMRALGLQLRIEA